MKKVVIGIGLFVATATAVVAYPSLQSSMQDPVAHNPLPVAFSPAKQPLIQMAILLDTSGSMDGLINQAREQLWQVVNQFAQSKKNGVTPKLEVAVYEYGNDSLSQESGYVRKVSDLTTELDQVSEALFALTTNGGSEYCGYVIKDAVDGLTWSDNPDAVKMIFIAGNEPFTQGPVPYTEAIANAKAKGITVNTIHAGDADMTETNIWKQGAVLAGGNFMTIDQNHAVAHFDAPQDKRLAELNNKLNKTYVPYGAEGRNKAERQARLDKKNQSISAGLMAKRTISKSSKLYRNENWDLVDAVSQGADISKMKKDQLPEAMRSLDSKKQKAYVAKKAEERKQIQQEIQALSKQRDKFIAGKKQELAEDDVKTMDEALGFAVKEQAQAKGYSF